MRLESSPRALTGLGLTGYYREHDKFNRADPADQHDITTFRFFVRVEREANDAVSTAVFSNGQIVRRRKP